MLTVLTVVLLSMRQLTRRAFVRSDSLVDRTLNDIYFWIVRMAETTAFQAKQLCD